VNRVTSIAEHLERHSVRSMKSTIPEGMTIHEWRTQRRRQPAPPQDCGHMHDTTTRYDHEQKLLSFLLFCPSCRTERVLETQRYEPRYAPHAGAEPAGGATIHRLPDRLPQRPLRRAA
jgi:hypothetical protein